MLTPALRNTLAICAAIALAAACGQDTSKKGQNAMNVGPDAGGVGPNNGVDGGGSVSVGPLPNDDLDVCGGGWCWVNPMPYGTLLQAVHGAGDAVFIVGGGGTVLQQIGGAWTGRALPGTHFTDVFAVRADLAYAVGWATEARVTVNVYRWDGTSWELFHSIAQEQGANRGAGITPAAVWASEDTVYVGGGPELHRYDGSWQALSTPGDGPWMPGDEEWVADITCADDECFAVGQIGSHLRFAGEGFIWRLENGTFVDEGLEIGALTTVDSRPDGSFIAAGVAGASAVTATRVGGQWEIGSDAPGSVADLVVAPNGQEWVVTTDFTFWNVHSRRSPDDWTDQQLPFRRPASLGPSRAIPALYATNNELFFVGRDDLLTGEIGRFDGNDWETFTPQSAVQREILDVALSETTAAVVTEVSTHVWDLATGERVDVESGGTAVFIDGGQVFTIARGLQELSDGALNSVSGAPAPISTFYGVSADTMFAADGQVVHRLDGGTWLSDEILPDEPVEVRALWARASDDAYLVIGKRSGGPNLPILWHFDGTAWSAVEESPAVELDGVVLVGNDTEVLVIGQEASSFQAFSYNGTTVSEVGAAGDRIVDADVLPDGTYVSVNDLGDVLRGSLDGWQRDPKLVEQRLNAVAADSSGNVWVGGVAGTLLRTEQ